MVAATQSAGRASRGKRLGHCVHLTNAVSPSPLSRSTRRLDASESGSEASESGTEPIAIPARSPTAGPSSLSVSSTGSIGPWSKPLDGPAHGSPRRRVSMPAPSDLIATPPSFKSSTARRRLSHGFNDAIHPPASPTSSPFASFAGSYEQSLLAGRMSTLPSKPLKFSADIGVIGTSAGKGKGKAVKIPPHVTIDFEAFYYDLPSSTPSKDKSRTPYVGTIDLEQHYIDSLLERSTSDAPLPKFPGYRIPAARGQIQLTIRNDSRTPIKLFLVPFDVTDMRAGEKTFVRQKTYEVVEPAGDTKHSLRYAAQLQFCAPPGDEEPRIYLHTTIRVVFSARTPDAKDQLRVVHEGPGLGDGKYSRYSGPSDDWQEAKNWAKARARLSSSPAIASDSFSPSSIASEFAIDPIPRDPDAADLDAEPLSPTRLLRFTSSALPSPTLATASSEPFFLQRRTSHGSPSLSPTRARHGDLLDGLTALSLSRPSSRTGRSTPPATLPFR